MLGSLLQVHEKLLMRKKMRKSYEDDDEDDDDERKGKTDWGEKNSYEMKKKR